VLAAGCAVPAAHAYATDPAVVRAVRVEPTARGARLVVGLSRHVSPNAFFLDGPARFVVDLPDTRLALGAATGAGPGAGPVARYRYAPRPDGGARLVLDLAGPATLQSQETGGRNSPGLAFDLAAPGAVRLEPQNAAAAAPAAPARQASGRRRMIVIDPGHGGRDPGAVGVTGVREKDVVLDAALKLRDALEARGQYRVALTRDADIFIPLEQRVRYARQQGADLFVSLHADANQNAGATGASVYTLSERGGVRARGMMEAQDWHLDLGEAPRNNGLVTQILTDLTQRETNNRSAAFAQTVIGELQGVSPLLANTHRSAGLFVLLAPDVPAVLLEMGFLTNAADERRLASDRERSRMADAVADAVDHYFAPQRTYMARA